MDLQKLIAQYPDVLLKRKRTRAMFCDAFYGERVKVNLMLAAFDEGIVSSMRQIYPWNSFERSRYIKNLVQQYSIVTEGATWAVDTWASLFSKTIIDSLAQLELEAKTLEQKAFEKAPAILDVIDVDDEEPEYELQTRSENDEFYINPTLAEKSNRIYIPCGFGNTDNGFFIYGIKKSKTCYNPNANVFALVYNNFIRSTKITMDNIPIYLKNVDSLYDLDYKSIFRIAITLLQLVKNNYVEIDRLVIAFSGVAENLKYAVEAINHYAALFCRLMGIKEIKLEVRDSKNGISFNLDGSDGVFVRNNLSLITNARELWYGRKINYHFTDANLPDLEYILKEISDFDYFKEGQFESLCKMVSARKHMVCIMPTGSGKSLIYYMISLLQPLPMFIIAPTDILIQDQIRNLRHIHHMDNVAHLMITADNDFDEFEIRNSLNYLTPTTLQNRNLLVSFRYINNGSLRRYTQTQTQGRMLGEEKMSDGPLACNIILDEIHCLSNLGHDFRPEYLMLSKNLNKYLDQIVFLGFTATANFTVIEDIQKQLIILQENFISPISFEKNNISYDYRCVKTTDDMYNEIDDISEKLIKHSERTIIFTKNDKISRKVAEVVGFEADVFSMDNLDAYKHFVDGKCCILIASEELGIGINLPDIRNIVHFGLPLSKSEYVQEIGRAGRANEQVCSYVIYLENDSAIIPERLLKRNTAIEDIPELLTGLENDYADIYRKLTNNCPTKETLNVQLIEMYKVGQLVKTIFLTI